MFDFVLSTSTLLIFLRPKAHYILLRVYSTFPQELACLCKLSVNSKLFMKYFFLVAVPTDKRASDSFQFQFA